MTANPKHSTGIVLAGGKSTRMKSEKGLMMLGKKMFISHIIDAMKPLVSEIIIISNSEAYDFLGYHRYEDVIKNAGPLAGLYTGLYYSKTEKNLVVSCDVPLIKTEILKLLIEASIQGDDQIIQCKGQGRVMPLIALYKKSCKRVCLELLNKGERRLLQLSNHVRTKTIKLDASLETYVQNINTPEQLKTIRYEYSA